MARISLVFAFDSFGGFIAGDRNSGLTSYAHPRSQWSAEAEKDQSTTARKMMLKERGRECGTHDAINWHRYYDAVQMMALRNSIRPVDPESISGIVKRNVPA